MKTAWEVKTLGEVIKLVYGKPLTDSQRKPDGLYPVYGANGIKDRTDQYFHNKESIIIGRKGSAGEINLTEERFWPLDVTYFISFDDKRCDLKFLYYLLSKLELPKLATGIKPGINRNEVYAINVELPQLVEQQRIVAILDETFAAIDKAKANAQKNLQNARALFDSYLQSVFANPGEDWEEKKIKEVAKHSLGKMLDKVKNQGVLQKYLRNINVRWFDIDTSDLLEMRFRPEEFDKYTVQKGDVLVCEGGYPGRAAIWQEEYAIYFQKAIHRVRFHSAEYNKLFVYFLHLSNSNGYLKNYCSGVGIQHFTGQSLSNFLMPLPPINKARIIVSKLDALSTETKKLEAIYQQKLTDLDELKKAILQKAFRGELSQTQGVALCE